VINHIAGAWKRNAQGGLQTDLQNNPYYSFVTCVEYKYIQCGIKKDGMMTYYDNVVTNENTTLPVPTFKNRDGVQMLVASMPDDQALGEWELHTLGDMRWNDSHQHPIKYRSPDIIKSMRWLIWQPAYPEQLIFTPQRCRNSDRPPKRLYTEMHTAEWRWETQVRRDIRG